MLKVKEPVARKTLRILFYFAEYPAACCGDEGVSRTLRSFSEVGLAATKNSADTSQLATRSFINHALKSANESKMWLALLRDSGRANGNEVEWLLAEFTEVANVLGSSIVTLRRGNTKE